MMCMHLTTNGHCLTQFKEFERLANNQTNWKHTVSNSRSTMVVNPALTQWWSTHQCILLLF